MKRRPTGLCGILAIDKPGGVTSHDVVNSVRRITGERRVGHAGTLDPLATGLMLVGVGAATRLATYLTGHDKAYRARIVFGVATDTDDAQGRMLEGPGAAQPEGRLAALEGVQPQDVCAALVGSTQQLPPAYSAIKKNGVAAYKAAREGTPIQLQSRQVSIYEARLEASGQVRERLTTMQGGAVEVQLPCWDVYLRVSKGTYVRSIARDLGAQLGCGAHVGALRRVAVGDCRIERACTLQQLEGCMRRGEELPWCDPAELLGFPVLQLDEGQVADVSNGRQLHAQAAGPQVSCVAQHKLLAVYTPSGATLRPATVIPGGVVGVA